MEWLGIMAHARSSIIEFVKSVLKLLHNFSGVRRRFGWQGYFSKKRFSSRSFHHSSEVSSGENGVNSVQRNGQCRILVIWPCMQFPRERARQRDSFIIHEALAAWLLE
jgi:UDP-N-acetylmuramate-alanine ligase